jgi:GGDEF domain-containing protein
MMVDVDRFKEVNDSFGHGGGDAALKAVADRQTRCFPRRGDLVARCGGDEFAVVLRDVRPEEARMLAERLVGGDPVEPRGSPGEGHPSLARDSALDGRKPRLSLGRRTL